MKRWGVVLLLAFVARAEEPRRGGELRISLRGDPRTFNPMLVDDDPGETVRYLTGGVLIRLNRLTQELEPALARSWRMLENGRAIEFELRPGVRFSDGTALAPQHVVFTMRTLLDPALHSPTGDSFGTGTVETRITGAVRVLLRFPRPVAGLERLFDQVAITNAQALARAFQPVAMAGLGPFRVAEYRPGIHVVLARNPYYGGGLPYLDGIRLMIQSNRDREMFRFLRGELDVLQNVDPASFERLKAHSPRAARDLGPSLESEQMWFNQKAAAPLEAYKKAWFRSRAFRRAVSEAINRADLCRVVYRGRAAPAAGPVSPANRFWFDARLKPHPYDPGAARERLRAAGFRRDGAVLRDPQGHAVEFSLITNAGNQARERMAAMVQQDLARIGIRLNVVPLDFNSLLERISRTFDYEACLLGLINVDLDPNGQMNVWLSSAENHQWNPRQPKPETAWEAEIDRLMLAQAGEVSAAKRKQCFDRVQEIVWEEAPFLYLLHPNALCAISERVGNAAPAVLRPQAWWNAERLWLR